MGTFSGSNLRMFEFDKCFSQTQHSEKLIQQGFQELIDHQQPNLLIHFGSTKQGSLDELTELALQKICAEERVQYFKAMLFLEEHDILVDSKQFQGEISFRALQIEVHRAKRDKNRLVKTLAEKNPELANEIRDCSHFVIQVNDHYILELADFSGLQNEEEQRIVDTLTNDFGSVTNEILRASSFYRDKQFIINEGQEASAIYKFMQSLFEQSLSVSVVTHITSDWAETQAMAADFAYKLKSYFHGQEDRCIIQDILENCGADSIKTCRVMVQKLELTLLRLDQLHI